MKTVAVLIFIIALVALESCAQNTQNGWQSSCRNGRNGQNGRNGLNGRDGKDGTNGVDGKNGINGRDGINGTNGKDGRDGRDGRDSERRNWKECAWKNIHDFKDIGVIKTCQFTKKSASTYLYAQVASTMRIFNCDKCCARWFITFDGAECSPVPIDVVVYMKNGTGTRLKDLHRPRVIFGHCKIQKKGTVSVALNVGKCIKDWKIADAHTGWNSGKQEFTSKRLKHLNNSDS